MPYYHIFYDQLVNWETWAHKSEMNLNYDSLVERLYEYKGGSMYFELTDVYETDSAITDSHEAKDGRRITRLINWSSEIPEKAKARINPRKVFIVHGTDDKPAYELAWVLEHNVGLIPIILREKINEGKTIIEKLEKHSDVKIAFIILTPDDIGKLATENGKLKPRARQNAIMELGYFLGKLGRKNICYLVKGDVELPSDLSGIIHKRFNKSVKECIFDIVKELNTAGHRLKIFG